MHIDWGVVFATLIGPILAVWASEWRQLRRVRDDRKEWVFRTLMTTRSARLNPDHIQALNHIDFVFHHNTEIIDAWGQYFSHLKSDRGQNAPEIKAWESTADSRLTDLIHLMAKDLNISFSKTYIMQPSYYPRGYEFTEAQQNELRALVLEVLKGDRAIPVRAVNEKPS